MMNAVNLQILYQHIVLLVLQSWINAQEIVANKMNIIAMESVWDKKNYHLTIYQSPQMMNTRQDHVVILKNVVKLKDKYGWQIYKHVADLEIQWPMLRPTKLSTVVLRDIVPILNLLSKNVKFMIMFIVVLLELITVTMKKNVFQILFHVVMDRKSIVKNRMENVCLKVNVVQVASIGVIKIKDV